MHPSPNPSPNPSPTPSGRSVVVPDVRSLHEARQLCDLYAAVITAGPDLDEVRWGHPNHVVEEFDDVANRLTGPRLEQVERLITFGAAQTGPVLVHCHAGVSRSTATAWGVAMASGLAPEVALDRLIAEHPVERHLGAPRAFWPNALIVEHLAVILGDPTILDLHRERFRSELDPRW